MAPRIGKSIAKQQRLERVASESGLAHVRIDWTEKELANLAGLLDSAPAKPTDTLIRAMKGLTFGDGR
jgi:hypothetical protein